MGKKRTGQPTEIPDYLRATIAQAEFEASLLERLAGLVLSGQYYLIPGVRLHGNMYAAEVLRNTADLLRRSSVTLCVCVCVIRKLAGRLKSPRMRR
jgi:hypothetical protein